jgi:SAM-dependent methyltransferase
MSGNSDRAFENLMRWQQLPLGKLVAEQEAPVVAAFTADLFGYHLVQLGELGEDTRHLEGCPIRAKSVVAINAAANAHAPGAVFESFRLPVATDSIDALILPHVLEFSADPYQLLREADRVLIPDGRLLVCGFNPISLWGLRKLLPGARQQMPWKGRFLSYPRVQDWLSLMGFDIERVDVCMFRPPFASERMLRRFAFLDRYGDRFWPMLAGVYVVRAVKRVSTLRLVEPRWQRLRTVRAGAIEPTTRTLPRG